MLVGQEVHHVSCIEVFSKPEGRYLHVGEEALSHKTNNTERKTTTAKLGAMMMSDDRTKNICHSVILMSSTVERCMDIFGFHTQEFGKGAGAVLHDVYPSTQNVCLKECQL